MKLAKILPGYLPVLALLLGMAGCGAVAPPPAGCHTGLFTIDAEFAGGALGRCTVVSERAVVLSLTPEDEPINPSPWYSFRVQGTGQLEISLEYAGYKHRYQPKISVDGATWHALAAPVQLNEQQTKATFAIDIADHVGQLYVSAQELMNSTWYEDWYIQLQARYPDLVWQTAGYSLGAKPITALQTNAQAKNSILLVGRQHPPEVSGAIAMVAFVEELLRLRATCPQAQAVCDFFAETNVVVVPLMNPDGVDAGHWRHNFAGQDLNRNWGDFSHPETSAIKALIEQLAAATVVRGFLDFHSTYHNVFYTQAPGDKTSPTDFATNWLNSARAAGTYTFENALRRTTELGTAKNYMHARFGVPAITYELGDETPRELIKSSAAHFAQAYVAHLYPYAAALDTLIVNGLLVDGTGAPPRQANVGIRGSRITYVGPDRPSATTVVDATNRIVSPGFIDPHTHTLADLSNPETSALAGYLMQGVTTVFVGNDGEGGDVTATAERLQQRGHGVNVGLWLGHGYLRNKYVGGADRAPSDAEMQMMQTELIAAVESGALGLSTGLFYAPGSFAQTQEIVQLATAAASVGGMLDSHIRDESDYTIGLQEAIREVISIGADASIPVHIAHIKALGPNVAGSAGEVVALIAAAQQRGVTVTADQYPWLASGTRLSNALIPKWMLEGGPGAMRARLEDLASVAEDQLQASVKMNLARRGGADKLLITGASPWQGKSLAQVAAQEKFNELQAIRQIILMGDPAVASFVMTQSDVETFAQQPWVVTSSDGSRGHPRKFGSFPKKYTDMVKRAKLMSLQSFVAQSSGRTASIFGLCDRGRIVAAAIADVIIWDPLTFQSNATYTQPTELASGVDSVWVNGWRTVANAKLTGNLRGRVVHREACSSQADPVVL